MSQSVSQYSRSIIVLGLPSQRYEVGFRLRGEKPQFWEVYAPYMERAIAGAKRIIDEEFPGRRLAVWVQALPDRVSP